jgi:hypothetical protein
MHQLNGEIGTPLLDFLSSLEIPTLIVDGEGRVQAANAETLDMVQKELDAVEGYLGGNVFSCVNANLPGGCGKTELCSACTVRNTVTHTYQTGETQLRVPASLEVSGKGGVKELEFLLTTQRMGERVLLRIEPSSS